MPAAAAHRPLDAEKRCRGTPQCHAIHPLSSPPGKRGSSSKCLGLASSRFLLSQERGGQSGPENRVRSAPQPVGGERARVRGGRGHYSGMRSRTASPLCSLSDKVVWNCFSHSATSSGALVGLAPSYSV